MLTNQDLNRIRGILEFKLECDKEYMEQEETKMLTDLLSSVKVEQYLRA